MAAVAEKCCFLSPRDGDAQGNPTDLPVAPDMRSSPGPHAAVAESERTSQASGPSTSTTCASVCHVFLGLPGPSTLAQSRGAGGAWVAPSVGCLTLGVGSGGRLGVLNRDLCWAPGLVWSLLGSLRLLLPKKKKREFVGVGGGGESHV